MPRVSLFLILVVSLLVSFVPAQAQEDSALVRLHELRREGRAICMIEHYHLGTSAGQPTRQIAQQLAMRDWAGFTAWEYGSHWGSTRLAKSKTMSCQQIGPGWACEFHARPCKPATGRVAGSRR